MSQKSAKVSAASPANSHPRRTLQKRESIAHFATNFSGEQLKELKAIFSMLDKDGDGQLTGVELQTMFQELKVNTTSEEIAKLTKELDKDGDGKVSFKEFIEGMTWMKKSSVWSPTAPKPTSKSDAIHRRGGHQRSASVMNFIKSLDSTKIQRVKELFDLADADHDGVITKSEFYRLCQNLKIDVSKPEFEVLFANLDTSNNGRIEFGEFLSGMRWLEKGANLTANASVAPVPRSDDDDDDDDDSSIVIKELKEKNTVLKNILKEILMKGLATARTKLKDEDVATAKTLLEVLDVDFVLDVQDVIGSMLTDKEESVYKKMKEFIRENS